MKLTYLLGAGASFNAIPSVYHLYDEIVRCSDFFDDIGMRGLGEEYNYLASAIEQYGTPDTFARALWLSNSIEELNRLRKSISVFFSSYRYAVPLMTEYTKSEFSKTKKRVSKSLFGGIDSRYLEWLATICSKDSESIFPIDFNVLTYNYDEQIENSLRHLMLEEKHKRLLKRISWPAFSKSVDTRIYHLNGVSGYYSANKKRVDILNHQLEDIDNYSKYCNEILEEIQQALYIIDVVDIDKFNFSDFIKFAWEVAASDVSKDIAAILRRTEHLVIIGYSFPNFNRGLDNILINSLGKRCRFITIVDPSMRLDDFLAMFPRLKGQTHIEMKVDSSALKFYVPSTFNYT